MDGERVMFVVVVVVVVVVAVCRVTNGLMPHVLLLANHIPSIHLSKCGA